VDPDKRRAWAKGGALLGELDVAAQAYGLVCPVGVVSHTGVGGLTLGGGMGRLQRKFGFTIDNLRRVELVTADGRLVAASESENPELFWAIRGAGANFGVVTMFEFELHPFDGVQTRALYVYPGKEAATVWTAFRDFAITAPDEVQCAINFSRALPEDEYPASVAGEPIVSVGLVYAGDAADAERVIAAGTSFGTVAFESVTRHGYLDLQRIFDEPMAWGARVYTKGGFTNDLPATAVERLVDHAATGATGDGFGMWTQGGAIARIPDDATAFAGRSAQFQMSSECDWTDAADDDIHLRWARAAFDIVQPHAATGRYVNDMTESGGDIARSIYGDAKYERLRTIKRAWDPDNIFHLNQNIAP
jgi:FAD/FMN-containing dehydrogenase